MFTRKIRYVFTSVLLTMLSSLGAFAHPPVSLSHLKKGGVVSSSAPNIHRLLMAEGGGSGSYGCRVDILCLCTGYTDHGVICVEPWLIPSNCAHLHPLVACYYF